MIDTFTELAVTAASLISFGLGCLMGSLSRKKPEPKKKEEPVEILDIPNEGNILGLLISKNSKGYIIKLKPSLITTLFYKDGLTEEQMYQMLDLLKELYPLPPKYKELLDIVIYGSN